MKNKKCVARKDFMYDVHSYVNGTYIVQIEKDKVYDYKYSKTINGLNETIVEHYLYLPNISPIDTMQLINNEFFHELFIDLGEFREERIDKILL